MSGVIDPLEFTGDEGSFDSSDESMEDASSEHIYGQVGDHFHTGGTAANDIELQNLAGGAQANANYVNLELNVEADVDVEVGNGFGAAQYVPAPEQPAAKAALDDGNVFIAANPNLQKRVLAACKAITLGITGLGATIGIGMGISIGAGLGKADEKCKTRKIPALPPLPKPPLSTVPDFDKLMEKLVDDWNNKLSDKAFFKSFSDFVAKPPTKSLQTVLYMSAYAARIARAKEDSVIDGFPKEQTKLINDLEKTWNADNNIVRLIQTASSLTYNDGTKIVAMNRFDILNTLSAAILRVFSKKSAISPPKTSTT